MITYTHLLILYCIFISAFCQRTTTRKSIIDINDDTLTDMKKIELLKEKIQALEGSLQDSDIRDLKNELLELEMRTRGEKAVYPTDLEARGSIIWNNFKYFIWSFVNIVWWLVSFNGILAILTLPMRRTENVFNEISVQTDKIYKGFMDAVVSNVDDSDKRTVRSGFKRYVSIIMGMLWSTLYPVLVAALTFVFMLKRSFTAFTVTLLIMGLVKILLPVTTSDFVFWYIWRCLEVVSFFSTAFILARPTAQRRAKEEKKKT